MHFKSVVKDLTDRSFLDRLVLSFLVIVTLGVGTQSAFAEKQFDPVGSSADWGLSVVDLSSGQTLANHKSSVPLKPASVLKLATSFAALKILGTEYSFSTWLLSETWPQDGRINSLYIKGEGDPGLTTEKLWLLARRLRLLGIRQIGKIVLVDGNFIDAAKSKGQRAFQTGSSELALNFNSVAVSSCSVEDRAPNVSLDPWEANFKLLSPAPKAPKGGLRVNQKSKTTLEIHSLPTGHGCETVYRSVDEPAAYLGEVLKGFLNQLDVEIKDKRLYTGSLPQNPVVLIENKSEPLAELIRGLNKFSTNFIAEQLLFALGRTPEGKYSRQAGLSHIGKLLASLDIPVSRMVDGSGLSHENKISSDSLVKVLVLAAKDPSVSLPFEYSLPVYGKNGTLKKRDFGLDGLTLRAKTGSINGVRSLAGYMYLKNGKKVAFAFLLNNVRSFESGLLLEKKLVRAIYELNA